MKQRLTRGVIVAAVAAVASVGVSVWLKSDQMTGIVLTGSLVGFILGVLFRLRVA